MMLPLPMHPARFMACRIGILLATALLLGTAAAQTYPIKLGRPSLMG